MPNEFSLKIAHVLSVISMISWLGAQLPQVYTNYKLKSCAGLALPFLFTWFAGDFLNLLGCILTDQLPFQKYIATYFVAIDMILLYQFLSYSIIPEFIKKRRAKAMDFTDEESDLLQSTLTNELESDNRYGSTLNGESILDGLVIDTDEAETQSRGRSLNRRLSNEMPDDHKLYQDKRYRNSIKPNSSSDSLQRIEINCSKGCKHARFSSSSRSRSFSRSNSRSRQHNQNSRHISQRTADVVYFSAMALFFSFNVVSATTPLTSLASISVSTVQPSALESMEQHSDPVTIRQSHVSPYRTSQVDVVQIDPNDFHQIHWDQFIMVQQDHGLIIGRISAWLCASLYLTSRLPQIWKNFMRKSVQGLSVTLFIMAFIGNSTYVGSIVLASEPDALRDALPYLIGSGGTLLFDLIIIMQSYLYNGQSPRPPVHVSPHPLLISENAGWNHHGGHSHFHHHSSHLHLHHHHHHHVDVGSPLHPTSTAHLNFHRTPSSVFKQSSRSRSLSSRHPPFHVNDHR